MSRKAVRVRDAFTYSVKKRHKAFNAKGGWNAIRETRTRIPSNYCEGEYLFSHEKARGPGGVVLELGTSISRHLRTTLIVLPRSTRFSYNVFRSARSSG